MMGAASAPAAAVETVPKPAEEEMSEYERLAKKLADDEARKKAEAEKYKNDLEKAWQAIKKIAFT